MNETDRTELETALTALKPAGVSLDRDRLMYQAGLAAAQSHTRILKAWVALSTAALLCVSLGWLGSFQAERPERIAQDAREPHIEKHAVPLQDSPAEISHVAQDQNFDGNNGADSLNYLQLRRLVLSRGLDALPDTAAPGGVSDSPQPELRSGNRQLPDDFLGT